MHPMGLGVWGRTRRHPINSEDSQIMATQTGTQGGTHEQHVKAGEQSHKNTPSQHASDSKGSSQSGGAHSGSTGTQGGTHEQHVKAGQQSHKSG